MAATLPASILELLNRGPSSAAELAQALEVSQPTLSRALRLLEQAGRVVRLLGTTRGARYGLARAVGSVGTSWPLYQIDEEGTPQEIGAMHAIEREHFYVRGGPPRIEGLFEGIPCFLQDARPAGFLGRAIPAAHPELALPARVQDWTDAHVITYLTRRGSESVGNLIVGAESLNRYLSDAHGPPIVPADERASAFPALAQAAMFGAPPGSSAQGEHPKFSVRLAHGEQVFLQSERFDRIGAEGRRGVASLHSVDVERYGKLDSWSLAAQRLRAEELLSSQDAERIALLDTFGGLIANSDRHFGNITLFDRYEGPFRLAPAYDMLPMLFAPQDGQFVERTFEPPGPTAATLSVWPQAREIAELYWVRLREEPRLSEDFRARCTQCLEALKGLPRRGANSIRRGDRPPA